MTKISEESRVSCAGAMMSEKLYVKPLEENEFAMY